jgi:hypothetical protein
VGTRENEWFTADARSGFVEGILLYLHLYPNDIERWKRGWRKGDAPGLAKMFDRFRRSGSTMPRSPGAT